MEEKHFWEALKSGAFVSMVKESSRGKSLLDSNSVFNVMKPVFAEEGDVERMYCIFIDEKNRVIAIEKIASGTISSAVIYPRELIKRILAHKAAAAILVHNHPSRDTAPSIEDKFLTMKLALALSSIDVTLHDHIIVGDGYYSMADSGDIKATMDRINDFCRDRRCQ